MPAKSDFYDQPTQGRVLFRRLAVDTKMEMSNNSTRPAGDEVATVLVVEDDAALRMLCSVNLELEHYRVLEAGTLDRAAELLAQERVNLVLLDLHVAGRHGTELLPVIRSEQPAAAICLLSGTSETDPPLEQGVDDFIRKPFELEHFMSTVERLCSNGAGFASEYS
jgi:DNA-binding response OmpR family regulator